MKTITVLVVAALIWARAAAACPDCPTSRLVRAQVCDGHFFHNLAVSAMPVAILLAVALSLRGLGRSRRSAP
jgi:hypothetical protein